MAVNSPTSSIRPLLGQERSHRGKHNKLFNSMINIALVYGIDEHTCRGLDMREKGVSTSVHKCIHDIILSTVYAWLWLSSACSLIGERLNLLLYMFVFGKILSEIHVDTVSNDV